jgi:nucleoside-diphosphate-sugar epimerase
VAPALHSIEEIPPSAPHREVDIYINEADARAECKAYIIVPSTIWGVGEGEIFDKGIANSFSDQMPTMARLSLDRGRAGMVGKGANIWPHVNISDIGQLFERVYTRSQKGDIGHGQSGFYLGIAGEYTLLSAARAIGTVLVEKGISQETQPTTLDEDEMKKYYGGSYYMGGNSRGRADRSKSIGWKPDWTDERDFFKHIKEEVDRVEKKFGRKMDEATTKVY